jgi:hypothetical protein
MRIIVCMSTTPPRAPHIAPVIEQLLRQTIKPDEIRIYVPSNYKRFAGKPQFPALPSNVKICPCGEDLGPATKILPALRDALPDDILIYCDDDMNYDDKLIERLITLSAEYPDACIAERGKEWTRYVRRHAKKNIPLLHILLAICSPQKFKQVDHQTIDIAEGYGGVLVKPRFFPSFVFQIPPRLWLVDDIWLSGCLAVTGTQIRLSCAKRMSEELPLSDMEALRNLEAQNNRDLSNTLGILHLRKTYGIWKFKGWSLENLLLGTLLGHMRRIHKI